MDYERLKFAWFILFSSFKPSRIIGSDEYRGRIVVLLKNLSSTSPSTKDKIIYQTQSFPIKEQGVIWREEEDEQEDEQEEDQSEDECIRESELEDEKEEEEEDEQTEQQEEEETDDEDWIYVYEDEDEEQEEQETESESETIEKKEQPEDEWDVETKKKIEEEEYESPFHDPDGKYREEIKKEEEDEIDWEKWTKRETLIEQRKLALKIVGIVVMFIVFVSGVVVIIILLLRGDRFKRNRGRQQKRKQVNDIETEQMIKTNKNQDNLGKKSRNKQGKKIGVDYKNLRYKSGQQNEGDDANEDEVSESGDEVGQNNARARIIEESEMQFDSLGDPAQIAHEYNIPVQHAQILIGNKNERDQQGLSGSEDIHDQDGLMGKKKQAQSDEYSDDEHQVIIL
ncbi:MAG: hypothetical protein EZS28_010685 [Streblomastix strix]|uniref:Uncharacterized protein n=1 Tax=Streblomastix strix TaxID=222440 RepID=A0A5J4WFN1_9EUKA|nr:MAG: hypothetical protein EZS28_010685 [Streblomastix strix]